MKHALLLAALVGNLLLSPIASAQQEDRTQWAPIEKSLTALLNEDWRIVSHTNAQLVTFTDHGSTFSKASQISNSFSFVLAKESKVVICLIDNPQPNSAASRCRTLN